MSIPSGGQFQSKKLSLFRATYPMPEMADAGLLARHPSAAIARSG